MIGDLPEADAKPPADMLFVCKLNPVTTEEARTDGRLSGSLSVLRQSSFVDGEYGPRKASRFAGVILLAKCIHTVSY